MESKRKELNQYLRRAMAITMGVFLVVLGRYGWLQLVRGDEMMEHVRAQVGEERVMQTPRGAITDRNGRELAISVMTKSLFVDPHHVTDAQELATALAPLVGMTEQQILDDVEQGGGFVWVKRRLEPEEVKAVRALMEERDWGDRLGFRDEAKRYYPNDALAANVLGFVGTDDKGLDGIEQSCDDLVRGSKQETFLLTDTRSRPILSSLFAKQPSPDNCKTIELTLDANVQYIVEQALDEAVAATGPKAITCIAMDPRNGDVLAMACRPSYNPNRFGEYSSEAWKNRAVSFIYEPGSTFKAVVAGAALQEKIVTPNQIFVDPGYVMISGRRIQNWNGASFGTITFTDVVKNSINTGFALIGLDIGAEKLTEYAKTFGFGERTGIDLPGEEAGLLFEPENMVSSDIATMAIGQSIAVTPLQLVNAMAAIANDGILLKPHIVKQVKNADGSVYYEAKREEVRRTIESATDKTLVGLLEQVVATGGGGKAAVEGYRIAGKTGTAQKIREDGAGYQEGHYIASFCGFAPVEAPEIVVLVMIDDPSGVFYGGQIAAPVAKDIFAKAFRYLHIEPSDDPFTDREPSQPVKQKAPSYKMPQNVPEGQTAVPDVRGKTIREAAETLTDHNLSIASSGSGIARYQSIDPGTVVNAGTEVEVHFEP